VELVVEGRRGGQRASVVHGKPTGARERIVHKSTAAPLPHLRFPGAFTEDQVARFGQAFKDRAVARLLPPESAPLEAVSLDSGVSVGTLERWRADALSKASTPRVWTAAARLEAVITTAALNDAARSAWCREHGVYPQQLEGWRDSAMQALAAAGEQRASPRQTQDDRRRIKELERDLRRKDKALAETAALLVLSKKAEAIFNKGEDE
jgi:transposase